MSERTKLEKRLASLVRERQRFMQMTINNPHPLRVTVSAGTMRTMLRPELCISYGLTIEGMIGVYLHILNNEIKQVATQVIAEAQQQNQTTEI